MFWIPTDENDSNVSLEWYRQRIARGPTLLENRVKYAQLLYKKNRNNDALAVLEEAILLFPGTPILYLMLANIYHRVGKTSEARDILHHTPAIPTDNREIQRFYLELCLRLEEDIETFAIDALQLDPTHEVAIGKLGPLLRQSDRADAFVSIAKTALQLKPEHTTARYQLALTYAKLGQHHEATSLLNTDQIYSAALPHSASYASADDFEQALVADILKHETLVKDPVNKATIRGFQTDIIRENAKYPALSGLLQQLKSVVASLVITKSADMLPPLWGQVPKQARFDPWAVVYPGQGRQRSHFHAHSWLSGVYYVSVPHDIDSSSVRGHLMVGALEPEDVDFDLPWEVRPIKPVRGTLILFPSYIPHATMPTQSDTSRICVAFDVIPIPLPMK